MAEPMYSRVPASRTTFVAAAADHRADRLERARPSAEDDGRASTMEGDLDPNDADVELDEEERSEAEVPSTRSGARRRSSGVSLRGREGELPTPGAIVAGKYRIERILEGTESSATARAHDVGLGHVVSIKYLLPDAAARGDAVARFLRAARTASQIQSEHAARVLDLGRLRSGLPFVVTEELSGWELDEVLRVRGPLPVQEAVEYIVQAADAVAEGHALGIVHGALNLTNLVLTRRPDDSPLVKVLGFGSYRATELGAFGGEMAESGFMTVLPYLAPEQIRSAEDLDDRADVWALGALLHTLLAGAPPFRGKTALGLLAVVSADPPRALAELRDDISPDLADAVVRCLEKERSARFANVGELVQALKPFASGDAQRAVERISRMFAHPTRPPPLPNPSVRSIVPVARPRTEPKAQPLPATVPLAAASRWLLVAALVGASAGAIGALAVVLSSNARVSTLTASSVVPTAAAAPAVHDAPATLPPAAPAPAPLATAVAALPAQAAPAAVAAFAPPPAQAPHPAPAPAPATTVVTSGPVQTAPLGAGAPGVVTVAKPQPAVSGPPVARRAVVAAAPRARTGTSSAGSADLFGDTR